MAEYAGLTIRIGGDTTSLNNALKSSTKSAAELQSRIRQATRAMQFDPTDLKNVDTRIKLTGDRMQSLQSKVQIARTAMKQLGESMVTLDGKARSVSWVAENTQNLSLKAKQADERFVGLRDSLASVYEVWNNAARSRGVDFLTDRLLVDNDTAKRLMSTNTSLSEMLATLREVNRERRSDPLKGIAEITPAEMETIKQLKQLDFHGMFEGEQGLEELVQQATDLGVVIDENVVDAVRRMRKEYVGAQQDKEAFDKALQLDQIGVDVQRWDSEIVSLSNDIRSLDDGLNAVSKSEPFQELESKLRTVDAALDNVNADLERTEASLELDPGNLDLAVRRLKDLQQQAELGEEKTSILRQELDMLNEGGANSAMVKSHQDLARWIEESAEAARKAKIELSDQQATVGNLEDTISRLQQHIAMLGEDSSTASMTDEVQRYLAKNQELEKALERVAERQRELGEAEGRLATVQDDLENARAKAEEYKTTLSELRQEQARAKEAMDSAWEAQDIDAYEEAGDAYDRLTLSIREVSEQAAVARHNVETLESAVASSANAVDTAKKKLGSAKSDVALLKDSISKLEQTGNVKAFKDFPASIEESNAMLKTLQGELQEAQTQEKKLGYAYKAAETENELAKTAHAAQEVSAELSEAANQANAAKNAIKGIDVGSILNPSTVKSIGMTLSATITPAITALGYKMIDASSTVDAAYRDMRKTVEGTEQQFEALKQSAIDFSRTHVTSADQILQIMAIGGELGVATENLETFAEVISNIDVATNLDVEGAADALGHLANIMHLTESDYVGFSDALVRLGNNGASTETEIANIAERIGSMASIIHMSAPDVLAWASTIASTGQNAEAAGTAVSKTMSFFETAVASAGGTIDASFDAINAAVQEGGDSLIMFSNLMGMTAEEFAESWELDPEALFGEITNVVTEAKDSLQGIADVAHMTADQFVKAWESDPTKVMKAFIEGLNDIEKAGGSADAVLQGFKITSVRQKQAIEGLMQTIGGLDNNLQMSSDAWNGISDEWGKAGDAANEAAKKAEGFSGQIQILKNMGQIALSELGEGAVPYIKQLSSWLEYMSTAFSDASASTKSFIVGMGGIAALAGPVLSFAGTAGTAMLEIRKWADETVTATSLVKTTLALEGEAAAKALTGSMTTLQKLKAIGLDIGASLLSGLQVAAIAAAVIAIGAYLTKLYNDYRTHIKATEGLSKSLSGIGKSASEAGAGLEVQSSNIKRLVNESSGYEKRLANLASTIDSSNTQYGAYAAQMGYYSDVIRELGGKSGLTSGELSKLSAALSAVNDECGTSYGLDEYGRIIDTTTGQIQKNTEALLENIEARKQQALIDYYSDDLAEATSQWAEAADRVGELEAALSNLESEEGHEAQVRSFMAEEGLSRDQAEARYQARLVDTRNALAESREEMNRSEQAMTALEEKIASATEEQRKHNEEINKAAEAQAAYEQRTNAVTADVTGNMNRLSKAISTLGKTDADFNAITEGLDAMHVFAYELGGVDMGNLVSSFDDVNGSMAQVVSTLESGGVDLSTWNAALEQAPEAAQKMSSVTSAAFQSMYEIAGSDLANTMTLIAGLNEVQVDDKTFYIGDNGSIVDSQGKVYSLETDLLSIPDEVITTIHADDAGAAEAALEAKRELETVDEMNPTPTISAMDAATAIISGVQGKLDRVASTNPSPSIGASDFASGVISSVLSSLRNLDGQSATVTIYENTVKSGGQATGGMNSVPVIPKHATGYIATGPTLTNQGWIGEDGIEAVANWATGGAVVPLTNKRYMLPIADAIADGMALRMGGMSSGQTNYYSINGLTVAPDSALARAMDATFEEAERYTRMGKR